LGLRDFAESQWQEAIAKQEALQDLPDLQWHFIGRVQSNKARRIWHHFHWIHSVDSLALAQRFQAIAQEETASPALCLQVKLRPDPTKQGWSPGELMEDLPALAQCDRLRFQGLMTILPQDLAPEAILPTFRELPQWQQKIRQQGGNLFPLPELSMGMSDDYPQAIAAGATMVRLGRILFGDRPISGKS
jgi:pyridoxal phosphate enzyme (YggS family)